VRASYLAARKAGVLRIVEDWAQSVTRAELARRLGTSPGHVTRLLSGSSNLTLATMTKMAFVLGMELRTSLQAMEAAQTRGTRENTTEGAVSQSL
jgi:transcriptional regulator with XRE-family HTH domain